MDKFKLEEMKEKLLDHKLIYQGKYLNFYKDYVELANGKKKYHEYVTHPGAVCILAINKQNQIVLERQYRYPFNEIFYEVPAGKLDKNNEDNLEAAKRELKEETGFSANNWQYLGRFCPTLAYTNETIHMYLATDLKSGETQLDEDEFLNYELVDLKKAYEMVMDNTICDGKSQAIILKCWQLFQ